MEKRKRIKCISILLVIVFLFLLIPGSLTSIENAPNYGSKFKIFSAHEAMKSVVINIFRENQKLLSNQKGSFKNTLNNLSPSFVIKESSESSDLKEKPFDYRMVIRQSIPHHFNGGKYKMKTSLS